MRSKLVSRLIETTLRQNTRDTQHATAAQYAVTFRCEHIYDRIYDIILKNHTRK